MKGLKVTADGTGVVSHAGVTLVRALADNTGLTRGLSKALASARLLIHDRGRVLADLACAIADGGEAISDFRVMRDQGELFGPVASVPTAWRALERDRRGRRGGAGPYHRGGELRPPRRVGAHREPARRPARGAGRGQGAGRRDVPAAGRLGRALPFGQTRGRGEFQGLVRRDAARGE